jgi:hypothetical protein
MSDDRLGQKIIGLDLNRKMDYLLQKNHFRSDKKVVDLNGNALNVSSKPSRRVEKSRLSIVSSNRRVKRARERTFKPFKMYDDRPYPPTDPVTEKNLLTKDQRKDRKEKARKEHKHLSQAFYLATDEKGTPLQHVFDVGRLGSPMWHEYRKLFKDQIKSGVKGKDGKQKARTEWESKWVHPEAFQMKKRRFLNLQHPSLYKYLEPDVTNTENALEGMVGSPPDVTYALMKEDLAKAKHGTRSGLSEDQKRTILLPWYFCLQRNNVTPSVEQMKYYWKRLGHGKEPWEYNKIFIHGGIEFKSGGGHAFFIEITFDDCTFDNQAKPQTIEIWEPGFGKYPRILNALQSWLKDEGWTGENNATKLQEIFHQSDDIPEQRDPFHCGQYMLITSWYRFRWLKPNFKDYTEPTDEPTYESLGSKYRYGRTDDWTGRWTHPGLDKVVRRFALKKKKDHGRLRKWGKKQMKGFK